MKQITFVFILIIVGCQSSSIDFELKGEESKLVLSSHLKADSPIRVQITRTFNPNGNFPKDITVNNAKVVVTENDKFYTNVQLDDQAGIYKSDSIIKPGYTYALMVSAPGFPNAESFPVAIPLVTPDINFQILKDVKDSKYPTYEKDLVKVYFDDKSRQGTQYFSFAIIIEYEAETTAHWWLDSSSQLANEEDCHTFALEPRSNFIYGTLLFSNQCLPTKEESLDFFIAKTSNTNINNMFQTIRAKKIFLSYAAVNETWFRQAKITYDQPTDIDKFVLAPLISKSNIKNGYGLIYASTEKTIVLE